MGTACACPLLSEPVPSVGCLSTEFRAGRAGSASRVVPCPLLGAARGLEAGGVGEDALRSGRSGSPPCSRGSPGETARQDLGSQTSGLRPVSLALLSVCLQRRCSLRQLVTGPQRGTCPGARGPGRVWLPLEGGTVLCSHPSWPTGPGHTALGRELWAFGLWGRESEGSRR